MENSFATQSNDSKAIYKEWLRPSEMIPASKTRKILAKKLLVALSIIGTIMGFCLMMAGFFSDFTTDAAASRREGGQGKLSEDDPVTWLKDIEDYKKRGSNNILSMAALARRQPTVSVDSVDTGTAVSEPVQEKSPPQAQAPRRIASVIRPTKSERKVNSNPAPSDSWSQIYGSSPRSRDATSAYTATAARDIHTTGENSVGARLAVKLKGSAASNPSGPVIAVLVKDANLGGRELARGTEIHGETRGAAQGARLMMSFTSIRPKDGAPFKFSGRAIATDGRMGVVGTQTLGGGSDIAASALGAGVSAGGSVIAGLVGANPLGAAIDGAMSPVTDKARRLDYEEDAVVLNNGARFDIYVDEI